jgi:hypothetical protein
MYWNLKARVTCPHCGIERDEQLQTHWMGEEGSCLNYYELGQRVTELHGIQAAELDGVNDDFISSCRQCGNWSTFGARIVNEAVVELFPLPRNPERSRDEVEETSGT